MLSACPLTLTSEDLGIYIYLRDLDAQPHTLPSMGMHNTLSEHGHQHILVKQLEACLRKHMLRGQTPHLVKEEIFLWQVGLLQKYHKNVRTSGVSANRV